MRPESVPLDIPEDVEEVLTGLHEETLVSALVEVACAGASVMLMVSTNVSTQQPLHVRRKRSSGLWLHHQMKMIGHEAIREHRQGHPRLRLRHEPQKRPVVLTRVKDSFAVVPAAQHVLNHSWRAAAASSWHVDVTSDLKTHARHSTIRACPAYYRQVTRNQDVVIIGAGIIGCAIGRELARRGASVRIFESRSVGAGATHASAGVLAPYIEAHDRGPLFDLTLQSLAMYDQFVAEVSAEAGISVEYRRCGTLEVAMDVESAVRLRQQEATNRADGILQWLDAAAARRLEPALSASIQGALFAAVHGYVSVPDLTEALAWAALRHGARLETTDPVTAVRPSEHGLTVLTADGMVWPADQVVVAAGSWSGQISTEPAPRPRVKPIKGQLLRLRWHAEPLRHIIWGPGCYIVPWENGMVLVGATVEDVGFDDRVTVAGVRGLLDAVSELLPDVPQATFVEARAGLRPASHDGLPIIRRSSDALPQLIYATGHYRNGVLLAPLTAKLVADFVF